MGQRSFSSLKNVPPLFTSNNRYIPAGYPFHTVYMPSNIPIAEKPQHSHRNCFLSSNHLKKRFFLYMHQTQACLFAGYPSRETPLTHHGKSHILTEKKAVNPYFQEQKPGTQETITARRPQNALSNYFEKGVLGSGFLDRSGCLIFPVFTKIKPLFFQKLIQSGPRQT